MAASDQMLVDFENMATRAAPDGVTIGVTGQGKPVHWIVVEEDSAPGGTSTLAETSGDATSYRFPLAIYDGFVAKDVDVSVRFKPISGEVNQAAGLMIRVLDTDNYYVARANALEDNVRLYKVVDGDREQFAGVDRAVEQGQWQTLGLRAEGDRFEVSLNGDVLFYRRHLQPGGQGRALDQGRQPRPLRRSRNTAHPVIAPESLGGAWRPQMHH
jgi:hypothetical protein